MTCTVIGNPGFFGLLWGLWDGVTALISLVASIFWDVRVYNYCEHGWWYNLGFISGIALGIGVGLNDVDTFIIAFLIILAIYITLLLIGPFMWGIGIGLGILAVFLVYQLLK